MNKQKPGYKTTEFWLITLMVALGAGTASGAVGENGLVAQIVGLAVATFGAAGYSLARGLIKKREGSDKAGWKTSEFWLSFAALVVSLLIMSGAVGETGALAKTVALVAAALKALGYAVGRVQAKTPSGFDKTDKNDEPISILAG